MNTKWKNEDERRNPWDEWKALDALMREMVQRLRDGAKPDELTEQVEVIHRSASRLLMAILVRRRVRNAVWEADDLAGAFCEMLLRAGFPTYDLNRPFWPYGLRILLSLCNSRWRDKFSQALPLIGAVRDCKALEPADAAKNDIRRKMRRHVARLPRNLRQAVILRYWIDMRPREAAKYLGITEGLYHQWMFKARRLLRESYGPSGEVDAA